MKEPHRLGHLVSLQVADEMPSYRPKAVSRRLKAAGVSGLRPPASGDLFGVGFLHAILAQLRQSQGRRLSDRFERESFRDRNQRHGRRRAAGAFTGVLDAPPHQLHVLRKRHAGTL